MLLSLMMLFFAAFTIGLVWNSSEQAFFHGHHAVAIGSLIVVSSCLITLRWICFVGGRVGVGQLDIVVRTGG